MVVFLLPTQVVCPKSLVLSCLSTLQDTKRQNQIMCWKEDVSSQARLLIKEPKELVQLELNLLKIIINSQAPEHLLTCKGIVGRTYPT